MSRTTTMTVRLGGVLGDFVSTNVGENGPCENVSEYFRDLVRRGKEHSERAALAMEEAEGQSTTVRFAGRFFGS